MLSRPDGEIHYQVYGSGYPVLLCAPGGMSSRIDFWRPSADGTARPWTDWTEVLPAAGFTAIGMDQRNAGLSHAAIEADHGWHTYAADQLALMDHLGLDRFHVVGCCMGASFALKIIEMASARITAVVLQNPIGVHPDHPDHFPNTHAEWSRELRTAHPALDEAKLAAFGRNMWGHDFVFCVDRAFVRACSVPTCVLPGVDIAHPAAISTELAALLPNVEVLAEWRGPEHLAQQEQGVVQFLKRHKP
jgi:pimeloyl-ACP methyl ester carboxylesterase